MVIVLPARGLSLDRWVARLDAGVWTELTSSLRQAEGTVAIPRFKVSFESTLNEPLPAMGMAIAMNPATAQFDRIHELDLPTWISQVRHESFVLVNEEGTQAAAVTTVEMRALGAAPTTSFSPVVDRPFAYAIQDDHTGAMLLLGVMHEPLQAESGVFGGALPVSTAGLRVVKSLGNAGLRWTVAHPCGRLQTSDWQEVIQ